MSVIIAAEQESYLLVARGNRFAVVEKRNNRLYNCRCGKRGGVPLDDLSAVSAIVDEDEWVDRRTAQASLDEAAARWRYLAEHMR
jgi:hypothetical protein